MSEKSEFICPECAESWMYCACENNPLSGDKWETPPSIEEMQQELSNMRRGFDLQWEAGQRAIKMWQKETGKEMVWPDKADLCLWLLKMVDALESNKVFVDAVRNHLVIHESGTVELHMMTVRNDNCVRMEGEQAVKHVVSVDGGGLSGKAIVKLNQ